MKRRLVDQDIGEHPNPNDLKLGETSELENLSDEENAVIGSESNNFDCEDISVIDFQEDANFEIVNGEKFNKKKTGKWGNKNDNLKSGKNFIVIENQFHHYSTVF